MSRDTDCWDKPLFTMARRCFTPNADLYTCSYFRVNRDLLVGYILYVTPWQSYKIKECLLHFHINVVITFCNGGRQSLCSLNAKIYKTVFCYLFKGTLSNRRTKEQRKPRVQLFDAILSYCVERDSFFVVGRPFVMSSPVDVEKAATSGYIFGGE